MPRSTDAAISALKEALSDGGYALKITINRKGDTVTATFSLLDLNTDRSVFKLAASGRMENIDVTLGMNLTEEALWDGLRKLVDLLDSLKDLVPFEISVSR